jgi:hypothetical protein
LARIKAVAKAKPPTQTERKILMLSTFRSELKSFALSFLSFRLAADSMLQNIAHKNPEREL